MIACAIIFVSCKQIDSGVITITNTTENAVTVIFGENYASRNVSVAAYSSVKEPYTVYFSVYPSPTEKYVYGVINDTTYTIFPKEIKESTFYVTNTTKVNQTIYNAKDPVSGEASIPVYTKKDDDKKDDDKNIEIKLDYVIGFEFAVKETETSGAFVVEQKKETAENDQGENEERTYYLIRSPGF